VNHVKNIIKYVIEFNNKLHIEDEDFPSEQLNENDIKIVLKGGLNIRLIAKLFFSHFEKNILLGDDDINSKKSKLKKFLSEVDSDIISDNPFRNTVSKSDIDFVIILNKKKLSRKRYDILKEKMLVLTCEFLFTLKQKINLTGFFGMEYNYKNIEFDRTVVESITPSERNSFVVCKVKDLVFSDKSNMQHGKKNILLEPRQFFLRRSMLIATTIM
jgi:hypothetical protein